MATTKQATYKQFNGTDWDTIYFKTSAGQVGESSTLYFLRPATHKVNGKSFYGTTHQGITLYGTDIMVNTDSTQTITQAISNIEQTLDNMNFASSDHDHDSTYFKLSNVLGCETFHSEEDETYGSYVLAMDYVQDNDYVVSAGALYEILLGYAGSGHTHDGLLSDTDRTNLNVLSEILVANDEDEIVNRINDVFALFDGMDDTTTLISLLNNKADKTHNHDSTYFKLSNVLGCETFHSEEDETYGSYVLAMDYVQDNDYVVSAGALYEILLGYAGSGHTHSDYLLKTGGSISGSLYVDDEIEAFGLISYRIDIKNSENDYSYVVLDPDTATYTIENKKISTTNIYYGAVDPTQDNNANNVQAGDIWLEYANGVG